MNRSTPVTAIAEARSLFPGAQHHVYMNVAVRGLLPTPTRVVVEQYLDRHAQGTWDKEEMFRTVERARTRFAELVNATADEIAITKNASEGLNIIAASLPWSPGDNLVFCPELEHPNNVYPWLNLERRLGIEVRSVNPEYGHIAVDEIIDRIDDRTRLVTVPTVTFSPGFITDVAALGRACRERNVVLVVDAAQSVGVLQTDVNELGVDALAVATQKGLLAFYGMGFLYCRRALAESLQPAYLARFGVAVGSDAHETAMDRNRLALAPGARRFDLGNYNYLGATAADASLGLLLDIGLEHIQPYVRNLAHRLAAGLQEAGLPVAGGPPGPHLSHIVAVGEIGRGGHDTANDPTLNDLYRHLSASGVRLSVRRGALRFSLHLYNNEDDVDLVVDLVKQKR